MRQRELSGRNWKVTQRGDTRLHGFTMWDDTEVYTAAIWRDKWGMCGSRKYPYLPPPPQKTFWFAPPIPQDYYIILFIPGFCLWIFFSLLPADHAGLDRWDILQKIHLSLYFLPSPNPCKIYFEKVKKRNIPRQFKNQNEAYTQTTETAIFSKNQQLQGNYNKMPI